MAKVTAPLLSLDARGQFGKTMVFIGWKGIKSVREYVVPANPNTAAQAAQRSLMASCVAVWKLLSVLTKGAWNDWAPYETKTMSGFNSSSKAGVAAVKINTVLGFANTFAMVAGDTVMDATCVLLKITDQTAIANMAGYTFHYGSDPRALNSTEALVWNVADYDIPVTGLTNGTQYYGRVRHVATGAWVSGLFTFTPAA